MSREMQTIDFKGKEYITVNERLLFFRAEYPSWSLLSEIIFMEDGIVVFKATIIDDAGTVRATGHAYEKEGSSFINKTSYVENCETSAWGRALANLAIGIDTSVASYDEVANAVKQQSDSDSEFDTLKEELLLAFEALVGKTGSRAKAHEALGTTSDWMKDIVNKKNVAEMKKLSSLISGKVDSL